MDDNLELIIEDHERRLIELEESHKLLEKLIHSCEKWRQETEKLQLEMNEYNKRSHDALDHNTKSNILLIASNEESIKTSRELAQAFLDLKDHIEKEHDPVIDWYKPFIETGNDIKGFLRIHKILIRLIVAGVITGAAFYSALHVFI